MLDKQIGGLQVSRGIQRDTEQLCECWTVTSL